MARNSKTFIMAICLIGTTVVMPTISCSGPPAIESPESIPDPRESAEKETYGSVRKTSEADPRRDLKDTPKDSPPIDAPKDSPPIDAPKDSPPIDAPKDSPPIDAPKDERPPVPPAASDDDRPGGGGVGVGVGGPASQWPDREGPVDEALKILKFGNIAYDTPSSLQLEETAKIRLLFSPKSSIAELRRKLGDDTEVAVDVIQFSNLMEASLSGEGFVVKPVTPTRQAVSGVRDTLWRWDVTATEPGKHTLNLVISVILKVDGETTPRVLQVFNRSIEVNVTLFQQARAFVGNNWQWLWSTALVPLAGWGYARRQKRMQAGSK